MQNRHKSRIFEVLDKGNLEELTSYLNQKSFEQEELDAFFIDAQPILYAAQDSFWGGVITLAKYNSYNSKNSVSYRMTLRLAIENNQIKAVQALLEANTPLAFFVEGMWKLTRIGDKEGEHALSYAIKQSPSSEMFKTIFTYLPNDQVETLLTSANNSHEFPLETACNANKLDIAEMIFANPNYTLRTKDYLFYLDKISELYQSQMVKKLTEQMKAKASILEKPITYMIANSSFYKSHKRMLRYLLNQGYNLSQCNENRETPIELASKQKKVGWVKDLILAHKERNPNFNPEFIEAFHLPQALLHAIKNNEKEIVQALLEYHTPLDVEMIREAVKVNDKVLFNLLSTYDANPRIKKSNGNLAFQSYAACLTLQQIEEFIKRYLPYKKPSSYEATSTLQFYQYAKILLDALNQKSFGIGFKDLPRVIEYLRECYRNIFTIHLKQIEELIKNPTWLNNKSRVNYLDTITATNRPGTIDASLSELNKILNALITQLDQTKNLAQHQDKYIASAFKELTDNTSWQSFPAVDRTIHYIDEYLKLVKPQLDNFVKAARDYLNELVGRIKKFNWKYTNWLGTIEKRYPSHIEKILKMLNTMNDFTTDLAAIKILIFVKDTFLDTVRHVHRNRDSTTVGFANVELNSIGKVFEKISEKILDKNETKLSSSFVPTMSSSYMITTPHVGANNYGREFVCVPASSNNANVYQPLYTLGTNPMQMPPPYGSVQQTQPLQMSMAYYWVPVQGMPPIQPQVMQVEPPPPVNEYQPEKLVPTYMHSETQVERKSSPTPLQKLSFLNQSNSNRTTSTPNVNSAEPVLENLLLSTRTISPSRRH